MLPIRLLKRNNRYFTLFSQNYVTSPIILGIESTFDDTGAAVVDAKGNVLGEALITQSKEHISTGGVDPRVAQLLHRQNLPIVVNDALKSAGVELNDLSAIATATKPGLPFCLLEGLNFSKDLVKKHNIPFIPVHHMEAHLLTVRMQQAVEFPFLTLLASGGHCILCLAHSLGEYTVLGKTIDEPPGAVFDKIARAMSPSPLFDFLNPQSGHYGRMVNGSDIERLSRYGDQNKFPISLPFKRKHSPSCDFSFSGMQTRTKFLIDTTPSIYHADIAASFQNKLTTHILQQVHRGVIFSRLKQWLPAETGTLVASGGVLCNSYLKYRLTDLCESLNITVAFPSPKLCRDNGIMIAWAGMEYFKQGRGISSDPQNERFVPKLELGPYIREDIKSLKIKIC